jgi:hypothetical protein
MRVFAGKHVHCCGNAATPGCFIHGGEFSPLLGTDGWTEFDGFRKRVLAMRSAKTIATWAAVACSMIAFSWVGLALLGF